MLEILLPFSHLVLLIVFVTKARTVSAFAEITEGALFIPSLRTAQNGISLKSSKNKKVSFERRRTRNSKQYLSSPRSKDSIRAQTHQENLKVALVTGSTDGIGLTTARALAKRGGYHVIVHGRDENRIKSACDAVHKAVQSLNTATTNFALSSVQADISSLEGCKSLVSQTKSILDSTISESETDGKEPLSLDILINNAGVFTESRSVNEETVQWDDNHCLEKTFAVNVAAPFVITSLLLPSLLARKSASSQDDSGKRIVIASSISQSWDIGDWDDLQFQNRPYSNHRAYSESKLLDAMLTMEIAERLEKIATGSKNSHSLVTCNCLDPGTVNTKMLLAGWGAIGIPPQKALDETWLSTSPDVKDETGQYYVGRSARRASAPAYDKKQRHRLWSVLSELAPEAAQIWDDEI